MATAREAEAATEPMGGEIGIEEASIEDRVDSTATRGEMGAVAMIAASETTTGAVGTEAATAVIGAATTVGMRIPKTTASSNSSHREA